MSNDWNRDGHIGFDSSKILGRKDCSICCLTGTSGFSVQKENAPSLCSGNVRYVHHVTQYSPCVKREDYQIAATLVNLIQAATGTPLHFRQDASQHKWGKQEMVSQVEITFICHQNVSVYQ